jgi:hypothetical protein
MTDSVTHEGCSEMTRDKRISEEITKLKMIYIDLSDNQKDLVEDLIRNAAFMTITLQDLQKVINEKGVTIEYQNGANQWGSKQSPEIEVYNKIIANYLKITKQLADLIPEKKITENDALMEFLRS